MFYSQAIPGILQMQPKQVSVKNTYVLEKVHASMPVEKSVDSQREQALASEAILIQLYEQFRRPIHSYTYRLLGNQEDADDVTQEVFVRACTSWEQLYEKDRLSSWLYRIATNLCVDALRRRKRISWRSLSPNPQNEQSSEEGMSNALYAFLADYGGIPEIAERELIHLALAQLAPDYASVLVLNAAQGIPYQEVAEIVGITPNAAATRISRAKKMFAEQYQKLSKDAAGKREQRR